MKLFFAPTLLFASMSVFAVSPSDIRQPESYGNIFVSDAADIISASNEKELDDALSQYHQATGVQVAVVTTTDTSGSDSPRTFANKVFESFELGDPELDNGLLVLLSIDDRRIEFETGYGLEGLLPDVTQHRIQQEFMIPSFKQGDYEQGLLDGTYATLIQIDKATQAEAQYQSQADNNQAPVNTLATLDNNTDVNKGLSNGVVLLLFLFSLGFLIAIGFVIYFIDRFKAMKIERDAALKKNINKAVEQTNPKTNKSSDLLPCNFCKIPTISPTAHHEINSSKSTKINQTLHLSRYEKGLVDSGLTQINAIECSECGYANKIIEKSEPKIFDKCLNCSSRCRYNFLETYFLLADYLNVYRYGIRLYRTKPLQATAFKSVETGWQATTKVCHSIKHCFLCNNFQETLMKDVIPTLPEKREPEPEPEPAPRHVSALPKPTTSARSGSFGSWGSSTSSSRSSSSSSRSKSSSSSSSSPRPRPRPKPAPRKRGGRSGGGGSGSSW